MNIYKGILCLFICCLITFKVCSHNVYSHAQKVNKQNNFYDMDDDYIYRLSDSGIQIIKINNYNDMEIKSTIVEEDICNGNIYLCGDKLFISGIKNEKDKTFLNILIYDVYDRENPVKINEFSIDGNYYLFKEKDGIIHLLVQEEENKISVVSVDLNRDRIYPKMQEFNGSKINFMYLSFDDLYIVCNEDMIDKKFTTLHKFHVDKDILTYVDKISFDGNILNEKFMNEHMDNLRILVSCDNDRNKIYFFDEDLKLINSIDGIFENENINNVYFDGDMCYASGFLKNGYFYIYDLKNNEFKEVGKLKLSSSINNIYKLSDNKFLAIGSENRGDTYKNLQSDKVYEIIKNIGIKVMLIDVCDKVNPKIFDEYLIKGKQVYSPSFMDESKLLYLRDKNILVLPLDINNYNNDVDINSAMEVSHNFYSNFILNYEKLFNGVYVFDVNDEAGIDLKFVIDNNKEFKVVDYIDIDYIKLHKNNIFIFTNDCLKVFNLEGVSLGEFKF